MPIRNLKILAIDDNPDNLITIKAVIREVLPLADVMTSLNGLDGIDKARVNDPDVILLDIIMPDMDGFEVCKILKSDPLVQFIPVLFLTAIKTDKTTRIKAIDVGADAFLSKPIDEIELMAQIQSMAKIKAGNIRKNQEMSRLEEQVEKRTQDISIELKRRIIVEKELILTNDILKKNHAEKIFVIECQKKLLEITTIDEINQFIADKVLEIIVDGYTIAANYDAKSDSMSIGAYSGLDERMEEIVQIIGADPRKIKFYISDMNDNEARTFNSTNLKRFEDGIYGLLCRKVPKILCISIEKLLKIKKIYSVGFIRGDNKMGGLTILAKNDISEFTETIEILTNQAALALHRVKAEEALKSSEARYKSIFDQSPIGIALTDTTTKEMFQANSKFSEIIGRTINSKNRINWSDITHPDDIEEDLYRMKKMNGDIAYGFNMSKRYIKPDASIVWVSMTIAPVISEGQTPCHICMIEDITEKKQRDQRIEYLSFHDTLTGLYNRAYYEESVARLDNENYLPLSIITGDINGLKLINDTLGHAEGDKVLVNVSKILSSCIRENDVLARIGGDEFTILLPRTNRGASLEVISSIYSLCNNIKKKKVNGKESAVEDGIDYLSISLGSATKTKHHEKLDVIEKIAEDNMYKRKLLEQKSFRSSLISSMRTTLFEKNHETEEHAARLVELSKCIGRILKLGDDQLNDLELLSTLHDIGKISIDDSILLKNSALSDAERCEMKKHTDIGYRIAMASSELEPIAEYILNHHERWDGKGYPQGARGEQIPLLSRILSVVDSYDAMTNDRPYRKAMSVEYALEEIQNNAGSQFDPLIAALFVEMINSQR